MVTGLKAALPADEVDIIMKQQNKVAFDSFYASLPDLPRCLAKISKPKTLEELWEAVSEEGFSITVWRPGQSDRPENSQYSRRDRYHDRERYHDRDRHHDRDRYHDQERYHDRDYYGKTRDDYSRPRRYYEDEGNRQETRGQTFSYSSKKTKNYDSEEDLESEYSDGESIPTKYETYTYSSSKGGREPYRPIREPSPRPTSRSQEIARGRSPVSLKKKVEFDPELDEEKLEHAKDDSACCNCPFCLHHQAKRRAARQIAEPSLDVRGARQSETMTSGARESRRSPPRPARNSQTTTAREYKLIQRPNPSH
ncbi:pre-mRNA-splicing factor 38B-like [Microplitis mediator]|uniref:pre-mRNA-splicing factor 38B-like n=1 Tax=Microplitis mediator TaxID=375433 RepID=UPI002552572A|nr:pre-mRNA-splicing factor 38B-like [Microplitis mediator]